MSDDYYVRVIKNFITMLKRDDWLNEPMLALVYTSYCGTDSFGNIVCKNIDNIYEECLRFIFRPKIQDPNFVFKKEELDFCKEMYDLIQKYSNFQPDLIKQDLERKADIIESKISDKLQEKLDEILPETDSELMDEYKTRYKIVKKKKRITKRNKKTGEVTITETIYEEKVPLTNEESIQQIKEELEKKKNAIKKIADNDEVDVVNGIIESQSKSDYKEIQPKKIVIKKSIFIPILSHFITQSYKSSTHDTIYDNRVDAVEAENENEIKVINDATEELTQICVNDVTAQYGGSLPEPIIYEEDKVKSSIVNKNLENEDWCNDFLKRTSKNGRTDSVCKKVYFYRFSEDVQFTEVPQYLDTHQFYGDRKRDRYIQEYEKILPPESIQSKHKGGTFNNHRISVYTGSPLTVSISKIKNGSNTLHVLFGSPFGGGGSTCTGKYCSETDLYCCSTYPLALGRIGFMYELKMNDFIYVPYTSILRNNMNRDYKLLEAKNWCKVPVLHVALPYRPKIIIPTSMELKDDWRESESVDIDDKHSYKIFFNNLMYMCLFLGFDEIVLTDFGLSDNQCPYHPVIKIASEIMSNFTNKFREISIVTESTVLKKIFSRYFI